MSHEQAFALVLPKLHVTLSLSLTQMERRLHGQHCPASRLGRSIVCSCLCCRGEPEKKGKIIIKRRLNAPLIRLWMRAARCSSSFMLCRFHGGINTTLSQHPAQPHQPRCTASTADYLILCLLTHLSLPATPAANVGRGLWGDMTHPLSAIMEVLTFITFLMKSSLNNTGILNDIITNIQQWFVKGPVCWI